MTEKHSSNDLINKIKNVKYNKIIKTLNTLKQQIQILNAIKQLKH